MLHRSIETIQDYTVAIQRITDQTNSFQINFDCSSTKSPLIIKNNLFIFRSKQ